MFPKVADPLLQSIVPVRDRSPKKLFENQKLKIENRENTTFGTGYDIFLTLKPYIPRPRYHTSAGQTS